MQCVDVEDDPFVNAEASRQQGIASMIATPLFLGGEPIGVCKVWSSDKRAFEEGDVHALRLVAGAYAVSTSSASLTVSAGKQGKEGSRALSRIQNMIHKTRDQADLLNLTYDAIILRDMDSRILFWNRGAAETYGWSESQANGRISHDLLKK